MDAKKTKLMNHLVEIRKNLVTDRVKENQGKAYVEEKRRKLLTIRRRGNRVILSGDNVRLRKVQDADPVIINYLRSLFLEAEDETELKFETDEDKETPKMFIPKLFCQVEDEKNGWHSKTVERYAAADDPELRLFRNSSASSFLEMFTSNEAWNLCSSKISDSSKILNS